VRGFRSCALGHREPMTGIEPAFSAWEAISGSERVSDNPWSHGQSSKPKLQRGLQFQYPAWYCKGTFEQHRP
jgi:hypothetical protein